eukprot:gene10422-2949_t
MSTNEYTVVVIGGGGVGKTSLTVQLTENRFDSEYNPTIEDTYTKQMKIDDVKYSLNILDTAGQEEYAILRDQYWRSGDGFLIVYDITNKNSFLEIEAFYELIKKAQDTELYPIVLCGNKSDLMDKRQVAKTTAEDYTKKKEWPYFETSAKNRENVEESFTELVKFIAKYKKAIEAQNPKGNDSKKSNGKETKESSGGGLFGGLFKKKKK